MSFDPKYRCRAHNRAGEQCKRRACVGKTLCKCHGGTTEGTSCLANIKHGMNSQFIRVDDLPAVLEKIGQAKTVEGRIELAARNVGLLQHRVEQVPLELEHLQVAAGGAEAVRRQLETLAGMTAAPAALPTFVIATSPDYEEFTGRYWDGETQVVVRRIAGQLWLQSDTNTMRRAVEVKDDDSGVTMYREIELTQ
jgi:hypothetical protein